MERAQREHSELIALARKGQIERACHRLALHIETVRKDIVKVLARNA
jgi:DNA-binding GntR family transcriptional regulator